MNCTHVGEDSVTCGGLVLGDLDGDLTCVICSRSPHTPIESAEARERWNSEGAAKERSSLKRGRRPRHQFVKL
jgi:hypothetical protein